MGVSIEGKLFGRLVGVLGVFIGLIVIIIVLTRVFCDPSYNRPKEVIDLGEIQYLLESKTFLRDKAILLLFDKDKGWAAISTRSTVSGCDLSYQDTTLFCPCSRSFWYHDGRVARGKAKKPLPYYKLYYETYELNGQPISKKRHLFANTSEEVDPSWRFAPEKILPAVPKIKEINTVQGIGGPVKIPDSIQGKGDKEAGPMFSEKEFIVDYNE